MDDAALMDRFNGLGQHFDEASRLPRVLWPAVEQFGQTGTVDVLHRVERMPFNLAHVVNRHDIRMREPRQRLGFTAEAFEPLGGNRCLGQHFQGDQAIQGEMSSQEDDPHTAAAQCPQQLISRNLRHERWRGRGCRGGRQREVVRASRRAGVEDVGIVGILQKQFFNRRSQVGIAGTRRIE